MNLKTTNKYSNEHFFSVSINNFILQVICYEVVFTISYSLSSLLGSEKIFSKM